MPKDGPSRRYEVRSTFRAPLSYVFRWCTHYTSKDGQYSGEGYQRRILSRSGRRVTFEDLFDTKQGWIWVHRTVRLQPPDRWHADSVGSDRILSVDYRLSSLPGDRTRLLIVARRRPYGIGQANPPITEWQRRVAGNWERLGRVLERDYFRGHTDRKGRRGPGKPPRRRPPRTRDR